MGSDSNVGVYHEGIRDTVVRSKTLVPARAYVILIRKEAIVPNMITGTFSFLHVIIYSLIESRLVHSYVYTVLVIKRNMPIDLTEFDIKVSNPISQCVFVSKVYKSCPLRIWGCDFPTNLMLMPLINLMLFSVKIG